MTYDETDRAQSLEIQTDKQENAQERGRITFPKGDYQKDGEQQVSMVDHLAKKDGPQTPGLLECRVMTVVVDPGSIRV